MARKKADLPEEIINVSSLFESDKNLGTVYTDVSGPNTQATPEEIIEFIADTLTGLGTMAHMANCNLLEHLLNIAQEEAREQIKTV